MSGSESRRKPEAPVNDGSNYNCLKVGYSAAFIKSSSFALKKELRRTLRNFSGEGDYLLETPIESDTTRNGENVIGATAYA
ncbi:MAG: hypothetical protein A3H54_05040 [Candidatus Yanofskybacteria bacterium RIFCSPLOWO2_02_FULL_41_13]|nr:MAG: hypothetical protein A3H54_05040 [Candidatus Yanofskybacteria bacterium RIFCSPLOWO2_02_FULL_41_13]